jgi:hypothetical protein
MWINTHTLPNAAFNIRPFIAGAFHAPANAHDALFFGFTEIVYQTHIDLLFGPARSGRTSSNKCDAGGARLETAGFPIPLRCSQPL